jgi:hypothetical protein
MNLRPADDVVDGGEVQGPEQLTGDHGERLAAVVGDAIVA